MCCRNTSKIYITDWLDRRRLINKAIRHMTMAIVACFHPDKPPIKFVNIPTAIENSNAVTILRYLLPKKKNNKIRCLKKNLNQNLI